MSIGSLSIHPQFTVKGYNILYISPDFIFIFFLLIFVLLSWAVNDYFWLCSGWDWSSSVKETGKNPSSRSLLDFSKFPGDHSRGGSLSRRLRLRNGDGGFTQNPHGVGDRDGIVIVDHGSRRKESNLMLSKLHNI